jgi:2-polyprenyl-3-methyl-5-hydroxy-6-metoxy-1,4-benzoquinol methylase
MFDWTKITDDPNDEEMFRQWQSYYNKNIVRFELFATKPRDEMIMDLCFQNLASAKILDVGFAEHNIEYAKSENWFHGMLRKHKKHLIWGLDINKKVVDDVYNLTGFDNLIVGDATDHSLIIDNGNFDAIHAGDIIEHLSNFGGFLKFCQNNLKPMGKVIITTPNPFTPASMPTWLKFGGLQANMEHTCWIAPSHMNELCRRHGFNFEESHYYMHKERTIKNRLRKKIIYEKKDLYFGEFIYVISKV